MYKGIDYSAGTANQDAFAHYGAISQGTVCQAWGDSSEAEYGPPSCGECGNEAIPYDDDKHSEYERGRGCDDFACETCKRVFDSDEAYPDEPLGFTLDDGEYQAMDCLDSDVLICKAPFYTFAPFCSPCVPGAGDLNSVPARQPGETDAEWTKRLEAEGYVRTYCFGADWFDGEEPPYPILPVTL